MALSKVSPVLGALATAHTPVCSHICDNMGEPFLQKGHQLLSLSYIQLPVSQNCQEFKDFVISTCLLNLAGVARGFQHYCRETERDNVLQKENKLKYPFWLMKNDVELAKKVVKWICC